MGPIYLLLWLYDTFLSSDPHVHLVVLSFVPLLPDIILSRIHSLKPLSLTRFKAPLQTPKPSLNLHHTTLG
ncbi:hypothetical protein JHK84_031591 [Glycine max]|nr:hypothetical protein JHK86_031455 [Glycine max]KAG5146048.1 hypothetical protein JHK84_031591 [Glycine max]